MSGKRKIPELTREMMSAYLDSLKKLELVVSSLPEKRGRGAILLKDVGWVSNRKGGGKVALRVFVSSVEDLDYVRKNYPKKIGELPVRPVKCKSCTCLPGRPRPRKTVQAHRDLQGGMEIANVRTGAVGTLGAVMYDAVTGDPMILSCAHVLVNEDPRDRHHPDRDLIAQPASVLDDDIVGKVVRADAELDCAVAEVFSNKRGVSPETQGQIRGLVQIPVIGMRVVKHGSASNTTHGIISGVNDQTITIRPSSHGSTLVLEGDSGSVWMEHDSGMAVGLLYKTQDGERQEEEAIASRMTRVVEALRITWKDPRPPKV